MNLNENVIKRLASQDNCLQSQTHSVTSVVVRHLHIIVSDLSF